MPCVPDQAKAHQLITLLTPTSNHCVSPVVVQVGEKEDGVEEGKAAGVEVNKYVEALQLLFREGYVPLTICRFLSRTIPVYPG